MYLDTNTDSIRRPYRSIILKINFTGLVKKNIDCADRFMTGYSGSCHGGNEPSEFVPRTAGTPQALASHSHATKF
jgi:hypothetical protein